MDNPFLASFRLPVRVSPIIVFIIITAHLISLFLPWLTGLEYSIKLILTSIPVLSFCFCLYKYYIHTVDQRVTELVLSSEDNWQVKMKGGDVFQAVLGKSSFVHPWLVIILLTYDSRKEHFILTPEYIDTDLFRRLRVRLRFKVDSAQ